MALTPPLGIMGFAKKPTKKKLKELAENKQPHFLTGYSTISFQEHMGLYRCFGDERFDNITVDELWKLLKETKSTSTRLCWQA
ncbi:hypothetical protein [Bacillus thuringiensis]|uniref:hypothetical protein n=1 Tax=Bacillus thuringiensis TaxID=1428 RepID=UPI000BFD1F12|nr:hypothetical protein [Bacillus thuringiensis]PGT89897.1 hypothetical protein COD17_09100 [Bacillus thuringiensis]